MKVGAMKRLRPANEQVTTKVLNPSRIGSRVYAMPFPTITSDETLGKRYGKWAVGCPLGTAGCDYIFLETVARGLPVAATISKTLTIRIWSELTGKSIQDRFIGPPEDADLREAESRRRSLYNLAFRNNPFE